MQLVAYVRVSTSKQELGPEAQREMINAYAAKHGHQVIDWYEEHVSGGADLDQRHGERAGDLVLCARVVHGGRGSRAVVGTPSRRLRCVLGGHHAF